MVNTHIDVSSQLASIATQLSSIATQLSTITTGVTPPLVPPVITSPYEIDENGYAVHEQVKRMRKNAMHQIPPTFRSGNVDS